MGDRAVIGIKDSSESPTIYLYSHYDGSDRYGKLVAAIKDASVRQGDDSYFTRIFLSSLVGEHWNQQLGYGISVNWFTMPDYPDVPVLNLADKTLEIYTGSRHEELTLVGTLYLGSDLSDPMHGPAVIEAMVITALEKLEA